VAALGKDGRKGLRLGFQVADPKERFAVAFGLAVMPAACSEFVAGLAGSSRAGKNRVRGKLEAVVMAVRSLAEVHYIVVVELAASSQEC
jgi:hypothetical protein